MPKSDGFFDATVLPPSGASGCVSSDFILDRAGDVELRLCDIDRPTEALNRYPVKAVTSG
jgi:hypothetical protein